MSWQRSLSDKKANFEIGPTLPVCPDETHKLCPFGPDFARFTAFPVNKDSCKKPRLHFFISLELGSILSGRHVHPGNNLFLLRTRNEFPDDSFPLFALSCDSRSRIGSTHLSLLRLSRQEVRRKERARPSPSYGSNSDDVSERGGKSRAGGASGVPGDASRTPDRRAEAAGERSWRL